MSNRVVSQKFDINKLLDELDKNTTQLSNILRERLGVDISRRVIYKWRERNSIPGQYVLAILLALQESKSRKLFDFRKYLL